MGYAHQKPMPTSIKFFESRRGRFVNIINKELNIDWDEEVREIQQQGPQARAMQQILGPQLVTSVAFFVASTMARSYRKGLNFRKALFLNL